MKRWIARYLALACLLLPAINPAYAVTNYITACGAQQFNLTIAAGALTANTTLGCSVGSGAFMVYQGVNPQDTAIQFDDTTAYLTISGSTVTATRGVTGSSKTLNVNGVALDANTSNLVSSVQSGTCAILSGHQTGTSTISAVTNNNTAVFYEGQDTATSTTSVGLYKAVVSLSGTTLTCSLAAGETAGATINVGWSAVAFQGTALAQPVQNIAVNTTQTGTTKATTITSVNVNNTMIADGGFAAATGSMISGDQYGALTAATTYTTTWGSSSSLNRLKNACAVEFVSGVLTQNAQRNTIAFSAVTSGTANPASAATSGTIVSWLGEDVTAGSEPAQTEFMLTQTNATSITATTSASATGTVSWEAITFTPFSSGVFQALDAIWMGSWI